MVSLLDLPCAKIFLLSIVRVSLKLSSSKRNNINLKAKLLKHTNLRLLKPMLYGSVTSIQVTKISNQYNALVLSN